MCGFTGLWRYNDLVLQSDRLWVEKHLRDMIYRGPNESKIHDEQKGLLMGFNRLAIRDLSPFGSQPFSSASGNTLACYNGETYNIDELIELGGINRAELKGHSDTEVLVECVEKHSLNWVLKHADGIFAIAIFDKQTNKLEIARDHLGIKPLYFGWQNDFCVFSSEYNPIVSHESFKNGTISADALQGYFQYGFIQEGEGLIENTMFVPQGHVISVESSGKWTMSPYDDGIQEFREKLVKSDLDGSLGQAVKEQMASDVPLGAFVSGGVDSVLVANYAATNSKTPFGAYTISVEDKNLDESEASKSLVAMMNGQVKHKLSLVKDQAILQSMDWFKNSMAEPLSDFSSLLMLQVCYEAKKDITVALSGDGGDELFFGYPRFRNAYQLEAFFNKGKLGRLLRIFSSRMSTKPLPLDLFKYDGFLDYYLSKQGITGNERTLPVILKKVNETYRPLHFKKIKEIEHGSTKINLARLLELRIHLQRVLLKVDRASMYHSVEVRVPLLSKKAVALSGLFNADDCMDNENLKKPLKKLLFSKLGADSKSIIYGNKKGFEPPLGAWLRAELKEIVEQRIFTIPYSLQPFINQEGIEQIWSEHQDSRKNNSDVIWALYSLFIWIDKNMGDAN